MSEQPVQLPLPGFDQARAQWRQAYAERMGAGKTIRNRSGIEVAPLYTPEDWSAGRWRRANRRPAGTRSGTS